MVEVLPEGEAGARVVQAQGAVLGAAGDQGEVRVPGHTVHVVAVVGVGALGLDRDCVDYFD